MLSRQRKTFITHGVGGSEWGGGIKELRSKLTAVVCIHEHNRSVGSSLKVERPLCLQIRIYAVQTHYYVAYW